MCAGLGRRESGWSFCYPDRLEGAEGHPLETEGSSLKWHALCSSTKGVLTVLILGRHFLEDKVFGPALSYGGGSFIRSVLDVG